MSSIYRFGFEGNYVPSGIDFQGNFQFVQGRSGVSSSAVRSNDPTEASVVLSLQPTKEIFTTFQTIINSNNLGNETSLFRFGPSEVTWESSTTLVRLKSNGVTLNSISIPLPTGFQLPFAVHSKLDSVSGSMGIILDNYSSSFSGNTLQGSNDYYPNKMYLGLGSVVGKSQFTLDDIAVNSALSESNSTASFGTFDSEFPPFIRCSQNLLLNSTGSQNQWENLDTYSTASVVDIANGTVDSYLRAIFFNTQTSFGLSPIDSGSVMSFEGANVFVDTAYTIQSTQSVHLESYLQINSSSINRPENSQLHVIPINTSYSALEKDLGGKMTISEFNNSKLVVSAKKFMNQNFFGESRKTDAIYTGSVIVGDGTDGFTFLEFNNLTVASGALLTTSVKKRGLVIYVKENCVIEGTISMNGKGRSGSLIDDTPTSVWKNVTSSFVQDSASYTIDSTWLLEQQFQPYQALISDQFGVSTYTDPEQNGLFGGGGNGGISFPQTGGLGGSSSFYSGGAGGGGSCFGHDGEDAGLYGGPTGSGAHNTASGIFGGNGGEGGGNIYLFVGKNLIFGSTGLLTAVGSTGGNGSAGIATTSGGGGGGGGMINVFYGINFYNFGGTILVNGGNGGNGAMGGGNGTPGGNGSYQIIKLLSN